MWESIKGFFCPKPLKHRKIEVPRFTLVFVDKKELNKIYDVCDQDETRDVNGLCYKKNRTIYVVYDKW